MTSIPAQTHDGSRGRIALVTGASRGVGEATVRRLARHGYSVVASYAHDQGLAYSVVDSILADDGAALAVRADVTDELDVQRLFAETVEWCGGVDAVIHAVIGTVPTGRLAETPIEQFDALIRLNTRATFLVSREAARYVRNHGSIVNLCSSLGCRTVPGFGGHAASLAATNALTPYLADELLDRGITINAIALDFDGPCEPDRIAEIAAYLLSGAARNVTGQVVGLDHPTGALGPRRDGDTSPRRHSRTKVTGGD
jgi:3-oxoacyl-[acyl-carrier protein] reductase